MLRLRAPPNHHMMKVTTAICFDLQETQSSFRQSGATVGMQAISEWAKSKTLQEQRRFLPVYDCREELLQVIRENQVVVVVGETGSGKTTQVSYQGCTVCTLSHLWQGISQYSAVTQMHRKCQATVVGHL